jgi:hypothetical protein
MNKLFNNKVSQIGSIMSLESKVNVVGSASIQRSIYYSDYDLFETIQNKTSSVILNHFRSVFNIIKSAPNTVISDFKCGSSPNGFPLRWDYSEIHSGINNGVSFDEAIQQKGIIKLDIISFINGRFVEITEVYNVKMNGKSNMDYTNEEVVKSITADYKDEVKKLNFMKALKKMYSISKLINNKDPLLDILVNYFNSPIGLLYRCKADLETILTILSYNKFELKDIIESLQTLKEQISAFPVNNDIEKISKIKLKADMKTQLKKQIQNINDFVNRDAKKFISMNNL